MAPPEPSNIITIKDFSGSPVSAAHVHHKKQSFPCDFNLWATPSLLEQTPSNWPGEVR
jgi:hypothetical protein